MVTIVFTLVVDGKDRAIKHYVVPIFQTLNSEILDSPIKVPKIGLKSLIFQLFNMMGQFAKHLREDPHKHIKSFMRIFGCFKTNGVSKNILKLKLYSIFFTGNCKSIIHFHITQSHQDKI